MTINVVVIPVAPDKFEARAGEPFPSSAEGTTRDEALQKLKERIANSLKTGTELTTLEFPENEHPLKRFAGMLKDDPLYEDWRRAMAERRKELDDDPNAL